MFMESKELLSELESLVHKNGFQLFGAARAVVPESDKRNILEWVREGRHGNMDWYPRNMKLRLELEGLGFHPETVFVLGALYSDPEYEEIASKLPFRFSRYATGADYHAVLKKSARDVLTILRDRFPNNVFRQGVDSLPVPEKILAREAGLGWIGKNTNLLNEEIGSYFFLTVIFTDLPLRIASLTAKDRCGTCDECIRACPTGALSAYQIDARKCISYKTIEDRSPTVEGLHGWVYGCDICQEVCPWNRVKAKRRGTETEIEEFKVRDFFKTDGSAMLTLTDEEFQRQFSDAAVNRISYAQFRRNLITVNSE
ncbi:epoxyqueuosine reductase [Leptospira broomii serovar Hurstbridge str. 5399]|uniref:Epoxyqueuosine reductase n=1 Tax=Leptospira broomii serovar Hurstbridge str. 5399 TaxID=1049789 RepID=T0F6I6_9LEPT|nr:tRNA epoxyqueuosine(34) reductase QueG [Leptospira broomii]EQA46750.1 epoxyqueuosine reductase [Leptospira broomii serovar Hurstbridge str. 5399]